MKKSKNYLIAFIFLFVFFQSSVLAAEPCSRPSAPSSVQAQTGPGAGQVTLYWTPAGNADYYAITYGLASGGYIYGSPNIGNNSQYTVSGLAPGRVYYFVLTSVSNVCGSSGYSEEAQSRAGGSLPVVAGETKGGVGWQPSGAAGQPGAIPSAQPLPLTEPIVQPLTIATGSASFDNAQDETESTISAEPSPLPFIPPKPEPFWRGWSFWSKVGVAAGVIFVILLAVTSLRLKGRKPAPQSSDVASLPVSADKMVAQQTVGDEPEAGPPLQEQEDPAPMNWPPVEPVEKKWPPQDKAVETTSNPNLSESGDS